MTKDFGWTDGASKLYTILAQDFLYKDPTRNVVFLDNHDVARFYTVVGEDIEKYKSSLCWLFTCRGIPQMYYTSEFATTGSTLFGAATTLKKGGAQVVWCIALAQD
jgi:glycosidase